MRFQYNTTAATKRLGAYTNGKASYVTQIASVRGFFTPISDYQSIPTEGGKAANMITQSFRFTTDGNKDIKPNDIVTIQTINYKVQGVARYKMASQDFLRVTLQLQANG